MYATIIKMKNRFKKLVILFVILFLLFATGVVLRNIALSQIRGKIQNNFGYSELHLSVFPPALILEDARSKSISPFFSARKIAVGISFKSLLSKERPLNILMENPILRIYGTPEGREKDERRKFNLVLPFAIEKGLIRNGALYYWGNETRLQSTGINALFSQKGDAFSVKGEAQDNVLSISSIIEPIQGKASFVIEGKGREIAFDRIKLSSPEGIIRASGILIDPNDPEVQIQTDFKVRADLVMEILDLPFLSEGWAEGKGKLTRKEQAIAVEADFSSKDLLLNKVKMGQVRGNVDYKRSGGRVDLNIQKAGLRPEYVQVNFNERRVWGTARQFYLDPVIKFADIPWPVSSPGWGEFSLDREKLQADVEFRDDVLEESDSKFAFNGQARMEWDRKNKFSFYSERLDSSFATMKIDGGFVIGKSVDLAIEGNVKDVKRAREFTSLVLRKNFDFSEIRGRGKSSIRIFGDFVQPQVHAEFTVSPGGFGVFDAESVEGEVDIGANGFSGRFLVDDPSMKGKIDVMSRPDETRVKAEMERGLVENILPGFGVILPLSGEASGDFEFRQKNETLDLQGDFTSSRLEFSGQTLTQVKGKIDWEGDIFSFPELEFSLHEGKIKGSAGFQIQKREFEIDAAGEGIDLSSIYKPVTGTLSFEAKGKGVLGKTPASGNFEIKELYLYPFQKTEARGELQLSFSEERVDLELDGNFEPEQNKFFISLAIPLKEDSISGDVRGFFTNYDLLLPWGGAEGRINYIAEIRGTKTSPQAKGVIDFQGKVFPFPQFAHALRDYSGLVFFENGDFSLRSIHGKLGGGDIQGSGRLKIGKGGVEEIDFKAEGTNMLLSPLERTRALADGTFTLIKDANRFVLGGEMLVRRLSWRREITEKFAFSTASSEESRKEPNFFENLTLDLRLKADDNAWMDNSLGRVRGRFDLKILGNINSPIVLGDIEALDGDLYFQDRKFRILQGRVSFINPQTIEPYLSFKGETYVKDYRVTFSLDGLLDHLSPQLNSSPPLPPEDVLALLAMGEAFKRTYSYDMSTQLSTASLLSFQLSEEAQKQAEGLFFIDRFRIDPFVIGSSAEVTARLTLGKNISRNISFLYSTNLTTQREEIVRIEWEITRDLSIVGTRDEEGRVSLDVKIHKRF
jgi:autotransporter translocation and assembly factor TamB